MIGDWILIVLVILIGITLLIAGLVLSSSSEGLTQTLRRTDTSLQSAYDALVMAGRLSFYTGIATLVIAVLAIIALFLPFMDTIPRALKVILKLLVGAGIVTISIIISAIYLTKGFVDIHDSRTYKLSKLQARKAFDSALSAIKLSIYAYYGIAVVTALIFIGMVIYDLFKDTKKPTLDEDITLLEGEMEDYE